MAGAGSNSVCLAEGVLLWCSGLECWMADSDNAPRRSKQHEFEVQWWLM